MGHYSSYSDDSLLDLLRESDEHAFTEIYNRYWEKLLFIAAVKLRSVAVAEELLQDIFLDIWKRRFEIEVHGSLESYLAVSMKYKVINAQAKHKRSLGYQAEMTHLTTGVDRSTEEWLAFEELQERLAALVSKLPEKCRITYRLSREEGFSHTEIAEELNITNKAVEANLGRAIRSLRNSLTNLFSFFF